MLTWLSANLVNIVLVGVIVLVVTLLVRVMIRDKKAGKSSCGGSCADCGACGGCSACSSKRPTADRSNAVPGGVSK
jgi:hypothetical protein